MSASSSASPVSPTVGRDRVRALQRVLYRSAKQDPERRFHALFDKVARSDVMWRAWSDVRTNKGAAGVDGVSIQDVETAGVPAFLEDLAAQLRTGRFGRVRCGGCISPSPAGRDRPGRWESRRSPTGW
jgi:RNA-directed DNA polymerase